MGRFLLISFLLKTRNRKKKRTLFHANSYQMPTAQNSQSNKLPFGVKKSKKLLYHNLQRRCKNFKIFLESVAQFSIRQTENTKNIFY